MKKGFTSTIIIILANVLPAYSYTESDGIDMGLYSTIAAWGFFLLVLILFSLFLYYSSRPADEPINVKFEKPVAASAGNLGSEALPALNLAYYSVIALLVLFVLSFILIIL